MWTVEFDSNTVHVDKEIKVTKHSFRAVNDT